MKPKQIKMKSNKLENLVKITQNYQNISKILPNITSSNITLAKTLAKTLVNTHPTLKLAKISQTYTKLRKH